MIDNINSAMELTPPCKKQCTHTSSAAQPHVAADTDADVDGDDSDDDMLGSLQEALEREADAYDQCMGTEEADETHGHFDVWVADAAKRTGEATVERHEANLRRRAKVTSKDCKSIVCHDDGEVDVSRIDPEYVQDEVEMLRVLGINGGIGDGDGGGPDSGSSSSNSHTTGDGGDCISKSMSMWACSFNESVSTFNQASENRLKPVGGDCEGGPYELSLTFNPATGIVAFVSWTDLIRMRGRITECRNQQIMATCNFVKEIDFRSWGFILHSIGVVSHHSRKHRPDCPGLALKLREMYELTLAAHLSSTAMPSIDGCFHCSEGCAASDNANNDEDLFKCCMCLMAWQRSCCDELFKHMNSMNSDFVPVAIQVPIEFFAVSATAICRMCCSRLRE